MDHVQENRYELLALAQGLKRMPTTFAVYEKDREVVELDGALLAQPLAPGVATLLDTIFEGTAAEVPEMIALLTQDGLTIEGQDSFLQ